MPQATTFRARGYTSGGNLNGSAWFVESMIGSPGITTQPSNATNHAGANVIFSVQVGGNERLSFRWRKNGQGLVDGGNIYGVSTPNLILSNILDADAGNYSVSAVDQLAIH